MKNKKEILSLSTMPIVWLALSSAQVAATWFAINGNKGAENLITFMAFFNGLTAIIGAVTLKNREFVRNRPRWSTTLFTAFDVAVVFMLAWAGWYYLATAWFLGLSYSLEIRDSTVILKPNQEGEGSANEL